MAIFSKVSESFRFSFRSFGKAFSETWVALVAIAAFFYPLLFLAKLLAEDLLYVKGTANQFASLIPVEIGGHPTVLANFIIAVFAVSALLFNWLYYRATRLSVSASTGTSFIRSSFGLFLLEAFLFCLAWIALSVPSSVISSTVLSRPTYSLFDIAFLLYRTANYIFLIPVITIIWSIKLCGAAIGSRLSLGDVMESLKDRFWGIFALYWVANIALYLVFGVIGIVGASILVFAPYGDIIVTPMLPAAFLLHTMIFSRLFSEVYLDLQPSSAHRAIVK